MTGSLADLLNGRSELTDRWWFPVLENAPEKRVVLGVQLCRDEERPALGEYRDRLSMRYQALIDRAGRTRARRAIEDLLGSAENVLMGDFDSWGELMVESGDLELLAGEAWTEIWEEAPMLDEETRSALERKARAASLRLLLASV